MLFRLALLALAFACAFAYSSVEAKALFEDFKQTFGRNYPVGAEAQRFACFQRNLDRISLLSAQDTASYVVNKFADLCPEEFAAKYLTAKVSNLSIPVTKPTVVAPTSFDWRSQGAVNAIKNQQSCGSCWAFSAVAAMEGAWKLAKGELLSLSEEELVQCATTAGSGCQGGWMDRAIQWVINNGGINSEDNYPYTSGNGITGQCDSGKASVSVAKFSSVLRSPGDEDSIAAFLVEHGPLSIAVDASNWSGYGGGIKTNCGGRQLNHGVAIVGYGEAGSTQYWIIRNSWGVGWGESGYIRAQRGVNCDGLTYMAVTASV